MDVLTYIIAICGGFLAGIVNTLAGNGSAITLSIFTELFGLPGNLANGTNRVGILFQSGSSSLGFIKNGRINRVPYTWLYILLATIGAIAGVFIALSVTNEQFMMVFRYLLLVTLLVVLVNPKRWLIKTEINKIPNLWIAVPCFLGLGFYGGFIQMGMGVFFLVVTVLIMKINIIDANALKTTIVAIYTIVVVFLFHRNGLIEWKLGLTVAIGQSVGGYLTADIASRYPEADRWAYRLLIIVIIFALLSAFDVI
jgi:uncharacterized membrane protein YfcA